MQKLGFTLHKRSKKSSARIGLLKTAHGSVHTPFFLPIATKASVKGVEASMIKKLGAEILLANTYHLFVQPGLALIKRFKGLHGFMQTDLPILTDSGGFQIFSLSKLRHVDQNGVTFQSSIDGSTHRLTPETAVQIQAGLDSDIMMALDYFPGYPATKEETEFAVKLTSAWAKRCLQQGAKLKKKDAKYRKQMLFGIVQGSTYRDLRIRSAQEITSLDFNGYAIGGLAVGEPVREMYKVLDYTVPLLPEDKPRYLMGVGYPEQIVEAVKRGIDMFDCVIPTREGRHGRLFIWSSSLREGAKRRRGNLSEKSSTDRGLLRLHTQTRNDGFYKTVHIERSQFKSDTRPVDPTCDCPLCSTYSRAYLHHLFKTKDYLGQRFATIHNLRFYTRLMVELRQIISKDKI